MPPATLHRIARASRAAIVCLAAALALAVVAGVFLFHTAPGRERLRRLLVARLSDQVSGRVTIARLGGGLPGEVVLHGVALTDSAGSLVLGVERIAARVNVVRLFSKRIDISRMAFEEPTLVLRHRRGGGWNVARVFARPDDGDAPSAGTGFGHWVRIVDASVRGGQVIVRVPWSPDSTLTGARRDSAVAAALAGETRARVERSREGLEQVMELRDVDALFRRVLLAHPDSARIVVDVARASMIATPFNPPAAEVRDLAGTLTITTDSLHFAGWRVVLPQTRMTADIHYVPRTRAMRARLSANPFVLGDLLWLNPAMPPDARGTVTIDAVRPDGGPLDLRVFDIDARAGAASAAGAFAVTLGDTLRFHDTDVRLENVDTELVPRLVRGLSLPVAGTFDARARLAGPETALRTDATIAFRDRRGSASRLTAHGDIALEPALGARGMELRLEPLQASLVRQLAPTFPLGGSITGRATVSGARGAGWRVESDLTHQERSARSRTIGTVSVDAGARRLRLDARVVPISLVAVGRAYPALGLHGSASGTIRAAGSRDSVAFRTWLRVAGGGQVEAEGRVSRSPRGVAYDVVVRPRDLDPRSVSTRVRPVTLSGVITARGTGTDPRSMRAELSAVLDGVRLERGSLDSARVTARVADGMAGIDTLVMGGRGLRLAASGGLGLVAGREGSLAYRLTVDSLGTMRRWLVPPVGAPATVDSATIAGALTAEGLVTGNVERARSHGRVTFRDLVAGGVTAAGGVVDYVAGLRRDDTLAVHAIVDSVGVRGLAYERADLRWSGTRTTGEAALGVRQNDRAEYAARVKLGLDGEINGGDRPIDATVLVRQVTARLDSVEWRSLHEAQISWREGALRVDSLELRRTGGASLSVRGALPTVGDGSLEVRLVNLPLRDVALLAQSDTTLEGRVSLDAEVVGVAAAPCATGTARMTGMVLRSDSLPEIRLSFAYSDRELAARGELGDTVAAPLVRAEARIPIDLALTGVDGPRLARNSPVVADARADSFPLVMLPRRQQVQVLDGWARGELAVRGTIDDPDLRGRVDVRDGLALVPATGVTLRDVIAAVRISEDSVVVDSLVAGTRGAGSAVREAGAEARAQRPSLRAAGSVVVASGAARRVAATVTARDAAVLDGPPGVLHVDADLALAGTLDTLLLTGRTEVLHGYVERKGPAEQALHVTATGDPELFAIVDTSAIARRRSEPPTGIAPARSIRTDLALRIHHGVWYRSAPNARIEAFTPHDLRVRGDLATDDLAAGGVVMTRGGIYVFRLRPFSIIRGTATLAGASRVAPLLQATGEHEVWIAGRGVVPVRFLAGGFPADVQFSLGDPAVLPAAPADLPAYLSLGRSPVSLLQREASSISGLSTSGGRFTGDLGALVRRQEVSAALGAVLYQLSKGARDEVGVRQFTTTPSDLPPELAESRYAGARGSTLEGGFLFGSGTYVGARVRLSAVSPGVVVVHDFGRALQLRAAYEPVFFLGEPTLGPPRRAVVRRALGLFLGKDWWF